MKNISIIGLGKVGITLCAALLDSKFKVFASDKNQKLVKKYKNKIYPFYEPGVKKIINKNFKNLIFCKNPREIIENTDLTFIIVPTNSNKDGGFSNKYILEVFNEIKDEFIKKKKFHTFALVSTIVPGSSKIQIIPHIEKITKKKLNKSFGFCYNPSFIAQGEILKGITNPLFSLIGYSSKKSLKKLKNIIQSIVKNKSQILEMSLTESEITKLASNTYETMRVSFVNMIAQIAHEIGNANVDKITSALTFRFERRFFKGAVPYGGPCWPRDNIALSSLINQINLNDNIPTTIDNFNNHHSKYLQKFLINKLKNKKLKIGILGLAYKIGTPLITKSFSINLIKSILPHSKIIIGYDPLVSRNIEKKINSKKFNITNNIKELKKCDVIIITQPFLNIDYKIFSKKIIVDLWRVIKNKDIVKSKNYINFGNSTNKDTSIKFKDKIKKIIK